MFIKRITSNYVDECWRTIQKVKTIGKYKDTNFVIDNFNYKGTTIKKRFIAWGDTWEKMVEKVRNKDGKFERII